MAALSLISLNIQRSNHMDRVVPFLAEHQPDIACIQEVLEFDIPRIAEALQSDSYQYAPMTLYPREGKPVPQGIAIFSRLPAPATRVRYYRSAPDQLKIFDMTTLEKKYETEGAMLLIADVEKNGTPFRIITTHFTWTPDGQPDGFQRRDLAAMLPLLDAEGDFVLCGDFNAPRGGEIFSALAARYHDNIPTQYTTSLDKDLHRAGHLDRMVDGLFTTPGYGASDVALVPGISDHCAIVGTIVRH